MIQFEKFELKNGLRVIVHQDHSAPIAVMNIMYNVGARHESPVKTGFAHLFEHLMFGGSVHIPVYDQPLQMAGGENNAYTTNDLTNYYIQLPAANLETAFWLESDRMMALAFSPDSLEVQRKVVSEEFKEHYLNKPYGDVWHKLRELAYKEHPYRWMTIGKELSHIENATLEDVREFFYAHYTPANAILVVAGDVQTEHVKLLAEKWFEPIPGGMRFEPNYPQEPLQTEARTQTVQAPVPLDAIYKTWHIGGRLDKGYYAADLLTEILGSGASSRLHQKLVKEQRLFSQIDCYQMGSIDPGLLVIEGKLVKGVSMQDAENGINTVIHELLTHGVKETELQKAKNKTESLVAFEDISLLSRANNLAYYELLGDAALMNTDLENFQQVTMEELMAEAAIIFNPANCSTLYYHAAPGQEMEAVGVGEYDDDDNDDDDEEDDED